MTRMIMVLALSLSAFPHTHAQAEPLALDDWQKRCARIFVDRLGALQGREAWLRRGSLNATPRGEKPACLTHRLESAAGEILETNVCRTAGRAPTPWERDDEWNYPIDPSIAWRERRGEPDVSGAFQINTATRRGRRASPALLAGFRDAARRSVDECVEIASTWRPPGGALSWLFVAAGVQESFEVTREGAISWGKSSVGGAAGEMGTVSAEEIRPLIDALRRSDVCGLAPHQPIAPSNGLGTLSISFDGLECTVSLCERDWRIEPRARAVRDAIMALQRVVRSH